MAVDTNFDKVSLLLQGGSTTNVGVFDTDAYGSYNLVVVPVGTTPASDHVVFGAAASLSVGDPTKAAGIQYGGGNVALDTTSMEMVLEHAWAPNVSLFKTATLQARGHLEVANRYELFARYPYWYSPFVAKLAEFDLPATGKVLVRVVTGAVDSVQVVPESGAAVTINHGAYSTFSYPLLLGDTGESTDLAPVATVATTSNAVDVAGSSGVSTPSILQLFSPYYAGRPTGQTPSSGSATLSVAGITTTITNVAGMTGPAIAAVLASQAVALLNNGSTWSASSRASGNGTTELVLTPLTSNVSGGTSASITGSAQFDAAPGYVAQTVPLNANSGLQQSPAYSPPPAVVQTQSAYITVNDPTRPLNLNLVGLGATETFSLQNNVQGAIDGAVTALQGRGVTTSLTQISAAQWRIQFTFANPGSVSGVGFTITESVPSLSAITKLYGVRVTGYTDRTDAVFPSLPWPTTSIPSSGGGGGGAVLPSADIWFSVNFDDGYLTGDYADASRYGHSLTYAPLNVAATQGSRTGDAYVYAMNSGAVLNFNAPLTELNGLTALTVEFDIYVPDVLGADYFLGSGGGHYMLAGADGSGMASIAVAGGWFYPNGMDPTTALFTAAAWHHIAIVYDNTVWRTYVDGNLSLTDAVVAPAPLNFTGAFGAEGYMLGLFNLAHRPDIPTKVGLGLDNVVITKTAKYSANFTPPGASLPASTDPTLLLLHFDDGPLATTDDASVYNHTVNVTNYISGIVPGKFSDGLNLDFAQATISQDTAKFALGTVWTIEFFIKANSLAALATGGNPVVVFAESWSWSPGWAVEMSHGRPVLYTSGAGGLGIAYAGIQDDNYHHVAFSCDGVGATWLFIDGVQADFVGGATPLGAPTTHTNLTIGWDGTGGTYPSARYTIDELRISRECLYTGAFTPPAAAFADPTTGGGGPVVSDIQGAGYNTLEDFTGFGVGNQQATTPPAYGSGSTTLDDFTVEHVVVLDSASINGTSARTLANFTNTGSGLAATPTNASGESTLDDFTSSGSGLASTPIEITADGTLDDFTQVAVGLFLAPSVGTADILLEEFTGSGVGELQTPPTGRIGVTMRMPTAAASGRPKNDTLVAIAPMAVASSSGRGVAAGAMPAAAVSSAGTVPNIGRAALTMPTVEVESTGRVSGTGAVQVFMPSTYEVVGYGGGVLSAMVEGFAVQATGISGTVGGITATLPMVVVEAVATRVNSGQIAAVMPMLSPSPTGRLAAVLPMVRVVASGSAVVTVSHEAYVLNMSKPMDDNPRNNFEAKNDQLTRYTNFPFTQVVRYLNSYYGVAADGLYLLDGTTDNGAPINWGFDLCTTDFGSSEKKTVASVYLGGQAGPTVNFTVQSGETPDQLHPHTTTATTVKRNHRQKFGLGRRTRYYSLGVSGQGDLAVDSIEFEVATTTRRI